MQIKIAETPVYYINLSEHTHHKTAIQAELSSHGFNSINRLEGIKDENGKLGCTLAHQAALQKLSNLEEPYIILEDDVRVSNFVDTIEVPEDADAVYLGNSKYGLYGGRGTLRISAEMVDENLFRVYNMLGAHAILYLNKDYANFIADKIKFFVETQDDHDKLRAETMKYFNIYALNAPLFYQYGEHDKVTNFKIIDCGYTSKRWSH